MKTIALFGGSFDPPHLGHYSIVHALLEIKEIDEIIVMPTYLNPFKDASFAPAELRLRWLKEIFKEERKVTVSDCLLYTSPSPRDPHVSRMPSSA